MAYRFSLGQNVRYITSGHNRLAATSAYKVMRLLPFEGDENKYRIKSADENFERVARESELERLA